LELVLASHELVGDHQSLVRRYSCARLW